ncbi:MAG: hypothetical protein HON90_04210, partial [Halobacteriovoraceae bacterium]|nr:hypothetical protein [Halobacteriovoraceae bacterium]
MSEVKVINLSQLDCDQFQKQGFIIQKPGTEQLWLGVGSNDDLAGARFFNNPFYAQDPVPFIPARLVACEVQEFLDWIGHYFLQSCKIQLIRSNDEQYLSDVENIIKLIHSVSGLKKLVAATKSEYSFSNSIHPISQAKKLMELNGSLYGKWKDGVGVLGVSPEPLFVQHNSTWSTTALAGTIKNDTSGYQKKLLGDLKEKEEH